jgi:hypothetical protein
MQGGREILDAIAVFWDGLNSDRLNHICIWEDVWEVSDPPQLLTKAPALKRGDHFLKVPLLQIYSSRQTC